jgi:cation diffusion facilitator family transporter
VAVAGDAKREVLRSFAANLAVAASKAVAAVLTGSGAMLAETLHSFADCGNQLLLLRGMRRASRVPDAHHPFGHGRELYFYSFVVTLLLFFGGGVFAIVEGIDKVRHPEAVGDITLALVILGVAFVLEGVSLASNLREIARRRGEVSLWRYLRDTKDSDLIVTMGENASDVLGVVCAAGAIVLARVTGDGRWDGVGSLAVGGVLVGVATFLAREVKSLLVGEAADPALVAELHRLAGTDGNIAAVLNVLTLQQGPGEILVAMKLRFRDGLTGAEMVDAINAFERAVKAALPDVRWSFIEPDDQD